MLILNKKISISSEQLEELQWNFQERCDLVLKVKKQGFTLSPYQIQICKKLSKFLIKEHFPRFLSFSFWMQGKTENFKTSGIFIFSSKSISWPLRFCLNSFLSFLNLELQQLSKFEVKAHFPRFPKFFILGERQNWQLRNIRNFIFFF